MLEPRPREPRRPENNREGPAPLLARVATSPSELRRALALLPAHAPSRSAGGESEVVVLYDPADSELAGAALIGRLSATTLGLFGCRARWIDEQLALRRLLQAVADCARTRDATFLAVRTNANDAILREVLSELGYRAADRALGIEVPPESGASWFALCL